MAYALAGHARRASWSSSAATSSRRKTRTGIPKRSGSTFATRRSERWLDERGREFRPYTHYNVGGNTKFWGSVLYRLRREDFHAARAHGGGLARRGRSTTTRSPRTTTARSVCTRCTASQASIRPSPDRDAFPHPPIPHSDGHGDDRRAAARAGASPFAAAARAFATAASSATRATRSRARCTRRARPRCAASARRSSSANVELWTNAYARRLVTNARGRQSGGGRGRA